MKLAQAARGIQEAGFAQPLEDKFALLSTNLEVVLELESLSAVCALEPPEDGGLVVRDHVPLQPVHVRELLLAHLADL